MLKDPAERVTTVSIVTTTTIGFIELWAGLLFGSIAIVAAGIDAIADTATSVVVFTGLRVSRRPADRGHPYGHAQAETIASLLLAVILLFAGVRVAYLALEKLYSSTITEAALELVLVTIMSIIVLGQLARYKIGTGRRINSLSVVADGYHTLTDTVSAMAVLAGLVFVKMGYPWVDSIVALGISILIVRWSLGIGKDALNILMGASPGDKILEKINGVCMSVPGVRGCHQYRARRAGSRILADVHIYVNPKLSVNQAHEISTRVERRLKRQIPDLASVVVHVEPARRRNSGKKR